MGGKFKAEETADSGQRGADSGEKRIHHRGQLPEAVRQRPQSFFRGRERAVMGREIFNRKGRKGRKGRRGHRVFLGEEKERLCLPKQELGKERVRMERGFSRIGRICTDLIFRGSERAIMPS